MESPSGVPETPTEPDDALYPCKGCGEILEEGKAFELAGNRWHIDCFRCNTCHTLLDSDANLLLLGDGSLICNNCTYSCSACGNKIEDLAILTGEQAFCASCFKCRNCKKKIENLRYARTSQGIFCMQCHESLMARRRKKNKSAARTTSTHSNGSNPTVLDKSLPALPPGAIPSGAFPEGVDSPASINSETPTERSPALQQQVSMRRDLDPRKVASPLSFDDFKENLGIPDDDDALKGRHTSDHSSRSNGSPGDEDAFIPVALDPMPRPPGPPRSRSHENRPPLNTQPGGSEERLRENFKDLVAGSASRSHSTDRGPNSPHIAQQSLPGRQASTDRPTGLRRRNESIKAPSLSSSYNTSPVDRKPTSPSSGEASDDQFKLQDVPRVRRRSSASKRGSKVSNGGATSPNMTLAGQTEGSAVLPQETSFESPPAPPIPSRKISARQRSPLSNATSASSQETSQRPERPDRKESLNNKPAAQPGQAIPRKQVPRYDPPATTAEQFSTPERQPSDPTLREVQTAPATAGKTIISPQGNETFEPPPRSSSRPAPTPGLSSAAMNHQLDSRHDFTSPREAPQPPPARHKPQESISSIQSEIFTAREGTPLPHGPNEAGMEDEFGRMGPDDDFDHGIFRKVSKAVRHGRSYSDKAGSGSPRFAKGSRNGSIDISSPMMPSTDGNEDSAHLRNRLRFSQQRIAELESEKNTLQEQVNGAVDIRQVNTELKEKRSTMAFLDSQREMVIRELEIMTEQLTIAKESNGPLDLDALKSDALKDFASQLHKLKETLGSQIEELMSKKNELTAEISNLIQMKDKGFQEYESLSTKNQQLQEHNNQLLLQIQELYRQGRNPSVPQAPSGLGIYTSSMKDRQGSLTEDRNLDLKSALTMDASISQLSGDTEVEPATVLSAPRVVDMRKGQPKKFSWKKGSENMAKNVKKGFKGAFASTNQASNSNLREDSFAETAPYGSIQAGEAPVIGDRPVGQRNGVEQGRPGNQGWGFLSQKGGTAVRTALAAPGADSSLFGSDLTTRCELEKRVIPALITRCIEEVENRGMDVEGIYRKSGSYSQVKAVQQGFERDPAAFDISDEDLDIHAVTSALKQFLRKLPMPLVTYEAYDELIDGANQAEARGEQVLVEACKRAVTVLPRCHRDTLELLIGHLTRVMERERENKMSPTNLAVVFAPTIMRPQSVDREMQDIEAQRRAVQALLISYRTVFA